MEEEDDLTLAVKRGILAIQEGDLARADRLLHIALKMAQDSGREEAITHIFCLMGNLAMERNFPGQAERLLKTVVQRLIAAGEPSDGNSVVEISLKLAQIYASIGSLQQAEQGFQFCVATQLHKLGKGVVDEDTLGLAGMVLDQRAQFLPYHTDVVDETTLDALEAELDRSERKRDRIYCPAGKLNIKL